MVSSRITWQNVDAPDFSNASRGVIDAARLLQESVGKAGTSITAFDKAQGDKVAQQLKLFIAQNEDPAVLEAAMKAGQVGGVSVNDRHGLAAIVDQLSPDDLRNIATSQRTESEAQRTETIAKQTFGQGQARFAADAVEAQARKLEFEGKPEEAAKLRQTLDYGGMGSANTQELLSGSNARVDGVNTRNRAIFDQAVNDAATQIYETTKIGSAGGLPEDHNLLIQQELAKYEGTPQYAALSAKLSGMIGNAANAAPGSAPGSAAAAGVTPGGVAYDRIVADVVTPPKPPSSMTLAELKEFGDKVVIPATKAMDPKKREQLGLTGDLGSSAMGKYQIIGDTAINYAQKLGWDVNTTVFTPENQELLAEAIWNDARAGETHKVFASLPKKPAGFYKNTSFAQIKDELAQGESGGSSLMVSEASAVARDAASRIERAAQDPDDISGRLLAAADVRRPLSTVAEELSAEKGKVFGLNKFPPKQAQESLQNIINRAKNIKSPTFPNGVTLTADQAVEVFRSVSKNEGFWGWLFGGLDPNNNAGDGLRLIDKAIDEKVKIYASGQVITQGVRNTVVDQARQANAASLATFQAADARYRQALAAASAPGSRYDPGLLARRKAERDSAAAAAGIGQAALGDMTNGQYNGDSSLVVDQSRVGNDSNTRPPAPGVPAAGKVTPAIAAAATPTPQPVTTRTYLPPEVVLANGARSRAAQNKAKNNSKKVDVSTLIRSVTEDDLRYQD